MCTQRRKLFILEGLVSAETARQKNVQGKLESSQCSSVRMSKEEWLRDKMVTRSQIVYVYKQWNEDFTF